ncbi:iron-containing alcohol dehydrogenase [Pseudooceanicola sp. CBS1P-1]|uniref:Iron-containing alcohol dehydrogenase n=1 Tax=Pseudooceanicola albus TaxID=2692189 RepID=A0A6L7G7P7_9RHOB|nr:MULTISPECIES: iron-containing alcohol dehydrogenase [Pseudooceanicola]MBT9386147.1 iron-containing alcohol dehydrogenase [Pseudooceanicola endophyticus]MXN19436.1 iron-containing alcohol dehydrogenase [Pseudooceanicola albus]
MTRILSPRDIRLASVSTLGEAARALGCLRPLVVVDPGVLTLGIAEPALKALSGAGLAASVFSGVSPDPLDTEAMAAAQAARDHGADGIIGIGGGSAMDIAKVAALLSRHGGHPRDHAVPKIVDLEVAPVICVPTTAGTGSEVTRAAVITDAASHEKLLMLGTALLPALALLDWELTVTCPFRVTVDSGLDALSHALEALVNRNASPYSDGLACEALRLIGANLERVAGAPQDGEARKAMLSGAMLAGLAVSHTSTALIHGMSRPIGAAFHVPHGMSNAMLMPLVTRFSIATAPQAYARAATALGAGDDLAGWLEGLNTRLEVPKIRDRGIAAPDYDAMIPEMVRQALASGTPANNPRLATAGEVADLYRALWQG